MLRSIVKTYLLIFCFLVSPTLALAVDCFDCHADAEFKGKTIHAPVADKDCLSCHGAHVSRHAGLLLKKEQELCLGCHEQLAEIVIESKVLHAPVRDGSCVVCHAPHASSNPNLLKNSGGKLCLECHQDTRTDYKISHQPFASGECSACHEAHGGADQRMLKKTGSDLCFDCHKQSQGLADKHLALDLNDVDCLSCHHPHGGEQKTLLRAVSHSPFADNDCQACHAGDLGVGTCLRCHEDILDSFKFTHNHLGLPGVENPCIACHDPHVGDRKGLLPENVGMACRQCHADTFERRENNLHKHPGWDACSDCHNLHGDNSVAMLKNGNNVCDICHQDHKAFTHPIGENALDERNGQPMDCLTCHNANDGSMYNYFLRGSGERGLCVQCHQSY